MTIRRYLSESVAFDPEAIAAMSKAFEESCIALHVLSGDIHGRLSVATRIIDLASTGVIDTDALRDRVIAESQAVATVYLDHSKRRSRDQLRSHPTQTL
jgi:hypothetical protein